MANKTIKAVCSSCRGTGVYSGMCEGNGHAVVCLNCDGTGCEKITYIPFKKRRMKQGIDTVSISKGRFILTGVGSVGEKVSYKEFLAGKLKRV
jgi:hypothetical protein